MHPRFHERTKLRLGRQGIKSPAQQSMTQLTVANISYLLVRYMIKMFCLEILYSNFVKFLTTCYIITMNATYMLHILNVAITAICVDPNKWYFAKVG